MFEQRRHVNTKILGKLIKLGRHHSQHSNLWIWQTSGAFMSYSSTPGLISFLHLSPSHCHPNCIREDDFDLPRFQSLHSWRKLDLIPSAGGGGANFIYVWQTVKRLRLLQYRIITAPFSRNLFTFITTWCVKNGIDKYLQITLVLLILYCVNKSVGTC